MSSPLPPKSKFGYCRIRNPSLEIPISRYYKIDDDEHEKEKSGLWRNRGNGAADNCRVVKCYVPEGIG